MPADFFFRQLFQRRKIDLLDQPPMQPHLGVEQLVAEQRTFRLRRGGILLAACLRKDRPGHAFERRRRRFFRRRQRSGVAARRAVKRPTILALTIGMLEFFQEAALA